MAYSKPKYGTRTLFRTLGLCYGLTHWLDTKSLQHRTCLLTNDHAKRRRRNDRRFTQRLGTTGDPRVHTSCLDGRRRNRRETPWRIKATHTSRLRPLRGPPGLVRTFWASHTAVACTSRD